MKGIHSAIVYEIYVILSFALQSIMATNNYQCPYNVGPVCTNACIPGS